MDISDVNVKLILLVVSLTTILHHH